MINISWHMFNSYPDCITALLTRKIDAYLGDELGVKSVLMKRSDIDTTIVNGKIVYHKGIFAGGICEADLVRECAVEVEKMRARI